MQISVKNQPSQTPKWKQYFLNLSVWTLLASNLLIIILAFLEHWSLFIIMSIYWVQSVGIGIVWFIKLLSLKDFTTTNFDMTEPTRLGTKILVSFFFLFHYGGFHLGYALFLIGFSAEPLATNGKPIELLQIVIGGAIFLVNQLFSFFYNFKSDRAQKPNIGKLMYFPYARIIPMHLTIFAFAFLENKGTASDFSFLLIEFLLLKTLADVVMHIIQLRGFADKPHGIRPS
jgi:hypothetical protein